MNDGDEPAPTPEAPDNVVRMTEAAMPNQAPMLERYMLGEELADKVRQHGLCLTQRHYLEELQRLGRMLRVLFHNGQAMEALVPVLLDQIRDLKSDVEALEAELDDDDDDC